MPWRAAAPGRGRGRYLHAESAQSSSTWWSTRRTARFTYRTRSRNHVAFEGPGIFAGTDRAGAHRRKPHYRARHSGRRHAAALEQAYRLRHLLRADPESRECDECGLPGGHGCHREWQPALCCRVRHGRGRRAYNTHKLEDDTFVPDTHTQIYVTGGGPSGLALDEEPSPSLRAHPI